MNLPNFFSLIKLNVAIIEAHKSSGGVVVPELEELLIKLGGFLDYLDAETEKQQEIYNEL